MLERSKTCVDGHVFVFLHISLVLKLKGALDIALPVY